MSSAMAGLLVGLGVAVFARAVVEVGFSELVLGHVVGPGLVAAGLVRLRLQRMLDAGAPPPPHQRGDGDDG
jgi:hypothetical protein